MPKTPSHGSTSGVSGQILTDIVPEISATPQVLSENCPSCGSDRTNTVVMPSYSKHHAALRCGQCDCFRGWLPKPSTKQKRAQQQEAIAQLLESPRLTDWERGFLESIKSKPKLSPRQQEQLTKIAAAKGGAAHD